MTRTPAIAFRVATRADLERIVELIADDAVAATRTGSFGPAHIAGFEAIEASPNDELIVGELEGRVVATMQLTFVPGISRNGAARLLVEAVRVDGALQGRGIGRLLMAHAHRRGVERGCTLAQLTSDKERHDAHRFYRSLGYAQSHEGFKRPLTTPGALTADEVERPVRGTHAVIGSVVAPTAPFTKQSAAGRR